MFWAAAILTTVVGLSALDQAYCFSPTVMKGRARPFRDVELAGRRIMHDGPWG